jgi:hypothetical protein
MDPEKELGEEPEERLAEPEGDALLIEAVGEHADRFLGENRVVYHEVASAYAHIDLFAYDALSSDGFQTYLTCGMASQPMNVPSQVVDAASYRYAELVLHLPAGWPTEWEELVKPESFWPLSVLRSLALLPHERESWIWAGHTLRNGVDAEPYAPGIPFGAAIVSPSLLMDKAFWTLDMSDGRTIEFLTVAFLYREELHYTLEHGPDSLFERMKTEGVSPYEFFVLDPNRRNACL